ncbi:hypothetical protein BKA66DRAFT_574573 [Pyrenochaeta sp. MPI-SDFR-AT-0127]|nr:hypothetical protein BKA66DRAFT_574573 [Pyrenochaeta sp. MPI-SDFR-AT-0127]
MANIATGNSNDERLICVYTENFEDIDDVLRVLDGLEAIGLLDSGRTVYYKLDANTYMDLKSATAARFGLQASLHISRSMMATGRFK